jgi:glutaredoxin-like YruB-family protein
MSVIVYSTPTCGYCHQVKAYLHQRGVSFTEHDVSRDRDAAIEMVRVSGQQGVPVLVIDGQVVVGFNRQQIDHLLAKSAGGPPRLGAAVADAAIMAARRGLQLPAGAYVGKVTPDSPAALAGLQVGDVVIRLAGQPVQAGRDIDRILGGLRTGQTTALEIWRQGSPVALAIQL